MRVLVTGATGQLGSEVADGFRRAGHDVITPDRRELDLLHPDRAADMVRNLQADWVINCAAYTQVDKAESEAETALIVNRVEYRGNLPACGPQPGGLEDKWPCGEGRS